jgi:hypothetical protein
VKGKLQFLIKKKIIFFSAVNFFQFLVDKALDPDWIRIGIQPKILDPDEMNADPQPCLKGSLGRLVLLGQVPCSFQLFVKSRHVSEQLGVCGGSLL